MNTETNATNNMSTKKVIGISAGVTLAILAGAKVGRAIVNAVSSAMSKQAEAPQK